MRLAWGLKNAFPTASCSVNWNWNWHWAPVALSLLPSGEDLTLKANKQPPSPASYNDCTKSNKVWSKVFVVLFLTIRLSKDLGSFLLKKKKIWDLNSRRHYEFYLTANCFKFYHWRAPVDNITIPLVFLSYLVC